MPTIAIFLILIALLILVNVIRIYHKSKTHHFECPNCGAHFQVSFARFFFTPHFFGGKCEEQCPKCGKRHLLKALPGKN